MLRKNWIKLIAFTLVFLISQKSQSQEVGKFITGVKGDSVFIFLTDTPRRGTGFYVERTGPGESRFERLTVEPVSGIDNPEEARILLGNNYEAVLRAVRAENPTEMLLRLRGNSFAGGVLSLLYRDVGTILGRYYASGNNIKGARYTYRVIFIDRTGKEISKEERSVLIQESPPKPPSNIKLEPGDKVVTIRWDYPAWKPYTGDLAIAFHIYRKEEGKDFKLVEKEPLLRIEGQPLDYRDYDVIEGVKYTYMMTAVDVVGLESSPSSNITILLKDRTAPNPPEGLRTIAGNLKVELIWHMSPELDVSYYNVYRSEGLDKPFVKINIKPIHSMDPSYVDSVGIGGLQFFYRVSAIDNSGNESKHSNAISAVPRDRVPPGKPKDLTYVIDNRKVKLTWKPPKDKDVQGYYVFRGESFDKIAQITSTPILETTYTDSGFNAKGLVPGRSYIIGITAVDNSWNQSERTDIKVQIPDDEPPLPPGVVRVENLDNIGNALIVEWNSSISHDVNKYELTRNDEKGIRKNFGLFETSKRKFHDTTVVKGSEYFYQVVAIDSAGNRSQPSISDTIFVKDYSPPPSPRFAQATMNENGVIITWERVIDFDLVGYNIYRSNLPTGVYVKVNSGAVHELKYFDSEGNSNSWYKIKSVDTSGNESRATTPVPVKMR